MADFKLRYPDLNPIEHLWRSPEEEAGRVWEGTWWDIGVVGESASGMGHWIQYSIVTDQEAPTLFSWCLTVGNKTVVMIPLDNTFNISAENGYHEIDPEDNF